MKIHLKFLGSLQYDLNLQNFDYLISNKGSTLKNLLTELLSEQKFKLLNQYFSENLELKRSLLIFINEQEISALNGLNTPLQSNNIISFIPVIHGGSDRNSQN